MANSVDHPHDEFPDEIPNELTLETFEKADRGEDVYSAEDAEDIFRQLGI